MNATLIKNIEYLLAKKHLNAYQLQEKSNIPQSTTFRILNGETTSPSSRTIKKYADFFGISAEDLLFKNLSQDGIKGMNNISVAPKRKTGYAPVLNYVQAGHFCEYADDAIADEFEPYDIEEYGEGCYWVIIEGKSMEPDFFAGDKVLVKIEEQPNPGDFVVALARDNKAVTFKKYRPRGFDRDGVEYVELVPSNPDFPIIDSRHTPFMVCAIALERKQKLR